MVERKLTISQIEIQKPGSPIVLKLFIPSDAEYIFELIDKNRDHLSQYGDETSKKYPTLETVVESIQHPKNSKRLRFAIRNLDEVLLGSINLTPDEDNLQQGEIGYYMGGEFQGKGFATEAVKLLSNFAFNELAYEELYAKVHPDNKGSQRVLTKAGYRVTGTENGDLIFTLKG